MRTRRRRPDRKLRWIVGLAVLAAVVAACGSPSDTQQTSPTTVAQGSTTTTAFDSTGTSEATSPEPVTITWLNLIFWDATELVSKFEAENPDINVEVESVPFEELSQQIQIRLQSGSESPDLVSVDVPLTSSYGVRGWLAPLDDVFTPEDLADFVPGSVEAGSYQGQLLAAPQSTSTQLLFLNKDLFAAANVQPPGPDDRWTYEQIVAAAEQMTDADTWGFTWEQTEQIYQLGVLPGSLGGAMIGDDGLTVEGVINSQPWVDGFTFYSDVFNRYGIGPKGGGVTAVDAFIAGDLAMMVGGEWQIRSLAGSDLDFEWGVSRHPYFDGGEIVTPTGAWHIGVNANSAHIDAAKTFAHWISTGEGAQEWFKIASFNLPAQLSVQVTFDTDEYAAEPLSFLRVAADESNQNPLPRALTPGFLEYQQILADTAADIRNGADVKDALDTAVARITTEMDKYR